MKKNVLIFILIFLAILFVTSVVPLKFIFNNVEAEQKFSDYNSNFSTQYRDAIDTNNTTQLEKITGTVTEMNNQIKYEKDNFIVVCIYLAIILNISIFIIGLTMHGKSKTISISIMTSSVVSLIFFIATNIFFIKCMMMI